MRWITIALMISLSLAGCTDDADDTGDEDPTDGGTGTGGSGGSGGNGTEERETTQVTVTWEGIYAGAATEVGRATYDKTTITVPANSTVELTFVNNDQEGNPMGSHDIVVDGFAADSDTIAPGEEVAIAFDVGGAQETVFYCSIPGHRDNGMEGTFIVE